MMMMMITIIIFALSATSVVIALWAGITEYQAPVLGQQFDVSSSSINGNI